MGMLDMVVAVAVLDSSMNRQVDLAVVADLADKDRVLRMSDHLDKAAQSSDTGQAEDLHKPAVGNPIDRSWELHSLVDN